MATCQRLGVDRGRGLCYYDDDDEVVSCILYSNVPGSDL